MDLPLTRRSILVVEDDPLIAMDVEDCLRAAGASVSRARTLSDALSKVEAPDMAAAVLDHALSDGDASSICERLAQRKIPFVVYSGFQHVKGPCSRGKHLWKPVLPGDLVRAVVDVIREARRL